MQNCSRKQLVIAIVTNEKHNYSSNLILNFFKFSNDSFEL